MGVDHSAVSGYGFVLGPEEKQMFLYSGDEDFDGDYGEALSKFLKKYSELAYLEAGRYAYTGKDDDLALAIVVADSHVNTSADYYDDNWWNVIEVGIITPEARKQLDDAADALAIDNPRFVFVSGVYTY